MFIVIPVMGLPSTSSLMLLASYFKLIFTLPHTTLTSPYIKTASSSPSNPTSTTPSFHIETSPPIPPILAEKASGDPNAINQTAFDPNGPDPNYSTAYQGPIHHKDLIYYLHQYDPHWWRLNLDIITGTACLCSTPTDGYHPAHIASYVQYEYYSHFHRRAYALSHTCGPAPAEKHYNECWATATGSGYHGRRKKKGHTTYCFFNEGDGQRLCVNWGVKGGRWMSWHGHRREFDREGTHVWEEEGPHVKESCTGWCKSKFGMEMDEEGDHGENFITSWFPPKPIPWN